MSVKCGSHEGNTLIPCECLDNHSCGMEPLESQVSPSDGFSIIVGKSLPADFSLCFQHALVEFFEGLWIKGLQEQRVHYGISFGYILGDDFQAFSFDCRHSMG